VYKGNDNDQKPGTPGRQGGMVGLSAGSKGCCGGAFECSEGLKRACPLPSEKRWERSTVAVRGRGHTHLRGVRSLERGERGGRRKSTGYQLPRWFVKSDSLWCFIRDEGNVSDRRKSLWGGECRALRKAHVLSREGRYYVKVGGGNKNTGLEFTLGGGLRGMGKAVFRHKGKIENSRKMGPPFTQMLQKA